MKITFRSIIANMVEAPKTSNPEHQAGVPEPVLGETGAAIRTKMLALFQKHPLWQELCRLRDAGTLSREDFGYVQVREIFEADRPVERKDVGNRPLILPQTDVEQFHVFSFVDKDGNQQHIFWEDVNGVLILFPEDFGDLPESATPP